jgi:hypothetical protein
MESEADGEVRGHMYAGATTRLPECGRIECAGRAEVRSEGGIRGADRPTQSSAPTRAS